MTTVIVHPNFELTASGIASRLMTRLVERQSVVRPLHVSLTGGTLGQAMWRYVASHPLAGAVDWTNTHWWFSDERFLPAGAADRNDTGLLAVAGQLGIPGDLVHSVAGPRAAADLKAAALAYAADLTQWIQVDCVTKAPTAWTAAPLFDVAILGVGGDGHVASLFPGRPEGSVCDVTTVAVDHSPKPPAQRVSLTRPVLQQCRELWMIAAGADKAPAVARALAGGDEEATPAAGLHGVERTLWFVDAALAQRLPVLPDKDDA